MKNKSDIKIITRAEYYKSIWLSGSPIDRPDDPIDENFIKHCESLKNIMNNFIDYCKNNSTGVYRLNDRKM